MSFEEAYRRYFSDVYAYIRRLSGDERIAEEITGETFFQAMRSLDRFRGECELRVWLCQIAKNRYRSYLKRQRRLVPLDEGIGPEAAAPDETPEEQFLIREDLDGIRRALHGMPEPYKEVFMWRVFGELSFREIGGLFGRTENWACVTYHRAKSRIAAALEEGEK